MSESVQPYHEPESTPVGHSGTRVVIHERQAWAINGWLGVLVLAAAIAACVLLAKSSIKGVIAAPIIVAASSRSWSQSFWFLCRRIA